MNTTKITQFEIANVKKVKAISMDVQENGLTVIGGKNKQGKTSILEAIAWALGGDNFKPKDYKNNESEKDASILVRLNNGIIVQRYGKNGSLKVTDEKGMKGGQSLLNEFVSTFAIDFPKFLASKNKAEQILKSIGCDEELKALEVEYKNLYEARRDLNRDLSREKALLDSKPDVGELPEKVDVSEVQKEIDKIAKHNQEVVSRRQELEEDIGNAKSTVAELKEQLAAAEDELKGLEEEQKELESDDREWKDDKALKAKIFKSEEINELHRRNSERHELVKSVQKLTDQVKDIESKMESVAQSKMALFSEDKMPIKGMAIEDGELFVNGINWDNLSDSERITYGYSIVRKMNPKCGFILLDKMEQLDVETLKELNVKLYKDKMQGISTRVSTGEECTIVIEDGTALTK